MAGDGWVGHCPAGATVLGENARLFSAVLGRVVNCLSSLVSVEPDFEDLDGPTKVVALRDQKVDVVEVFLTAEAVSQVVARIHRGLQFPTSGAEKAIKSVAPFGKRSLATQGGNHDRHRQDDAVRRAVTFDRGSRVIWFSASEARRGKSMANDQQWAISIDRHVPPEERPRRRGRQTPVATWVLPAFR